MLYSTLILIFLGLSVEVSVEEMSVSLKILIVGSGGKLVFLHGRGVNSGVWKPLVDIIKDECCITTIDLREKLKELSIPCQMFFGRLFLVA
jgi:hypothetical protein